jgi:hypothetical protein
VFQYVGYVERLNITGGRWDDSEDAPASEGVA